MLTSDLDPIRLLRPRRKTAGASAILLPFDEAGAVDWAAFAAHARRTAECGLMPAVNMDTGYVNLLEDDLRDEVLARTRAALEGGPFLAGAFVADRPGDAWNRDLLPPADRVDSGSRRHAGHLPVARADLDGRRRDR